MANKSFRERSTADREEILAFWGSTRGLITTGIISAGVIVFIVYSLVSGLLG